MADILQVQRRYFSGLDADIPASASNGDRYFATDTNKLYYWDGAAWRTGLGYEFVGRPLAVTDKAVGNFTTDGTWKVDGLDFSGIIPAGAVQALIKIEIKDDAGNSQFSIRKNATHVVNEITNITQVANIWFNKTEPILCDSDRLFDYYGSNLAFVSINVSVLGWWI